MMGKTQAVAGAVCGLAVSVAVDAPLILAVVAAVVGAVSSYVSDLDHPSATATNSLGPITWGLCWLIRHLSVWTTGRAHRGLSHSLVFCAGWGVLVGAFTWPWTSMYGAAWLAMSAFLGATAGVFADVLTKQGCQFVLWPATVQVSIPKRLRIRTGGVGEARIMRALIAAGAVLMLGAAL